jgi:hypothetical protein
MYLLAAEGADTWGISGPAFLRIYVIAAAGFLTGTLLIRRWIRGGRRSERELHPYEVAYLIGGPRRAIATAVAGLRADDAIEASEDGQLCVTAAPRVMRTPLDTAIHNTVQAGKVTSAQTLRVGYEVGRPSTSFGTCSSATVWRSGRVSAPDPGSPWCSWWSCWASVSRGWWPARGTATPSGTCC